MDMSSSAVDPLEALAMSKTNNSLSVDGGGMVGCDVEAGYEDDGSRLAKMLSQSPQFRLSPQDSDEVGLVAHFLPS